MPHTLGLIGLGGDRAANLVFGFFEGQSAAGMLKQKFANHPNQGLPSSYPTVPPPSLPIRNKLQWGLPF